MSPSIEPYKQAFDATWTDDTPVDQVRFVVLDSETTGFSPVLDRILTIGAVVVQDGEIRLDDSFDALLRVTGDVGPVDVHGVTPDRSQRGYEEGEAIERFLDYLRDGVIVGHHIGHDVSMLDAGLDRLGTDVRLLNRALDTADLTLHLAKDGAFTDRTLPGHITLDTLADLFGVIPHDRHTASGDAFITALVFLRLLKLAARHGRTRLGAICQEFVLPE
ncbi:MAG TPA: 3'-5' exonuclease [Vicinamibacterales bacterium]|jgi:DNA polymerase-3 subunit epsilon|nr:3'-5' exonuclease [Vicinamibacterales bacterium]